MRVQLFEPLCINFYILLTIETLKWRKKGREKEIFDIFVLLIYLTALLQLMVLYSVKWIRIMNYRLEEH